jgi:hypothetical protein
MKRRFSECRFGVLLSFDVLLGYDPKSQKNGDLMSQN